MHECVYVFLCICTCACVCFLYIRVCFYACVCISICVCVVCACVLVRACVCERRFDALASGGAASMGLSLGPLLSPCTVPRETPVFPGKGFFLFLLVHKAHAENSNNTTTAATSLVFGRSASGRTARSCPRPLLSLIHGQITDVRKKKEKKC